ncbi:MAG: hypothetical protein E7476_01835 [Ruminococcaceae bacterium]|nr:hypothetical protein [Oscillospiraceae bacterium]
MQNVIGGMASKGLVWLFEQFGSWVYEWIFGAVSKLVDDILSLTTSATSVFWDVPAIELCLDFFTWVNGVVLVVSLLFLCVEITEQNGRVNWSIVFTNLFKGFAFVFFNRYIGLATFVVTEQATQAMDIALNTPSSAIIGTWLTGMNSGIFIILMILVVLAAFVSFFIMSMLRNGSLLVQIFSSAFYIPSIIRGDTAKLTDWLEQTVAISATYFIQYLLFCIGLDHLTGFSGPGLVTTATCWLTMFFVPKILSKFGYSSGTASVLSAAGSVVNSGISFVK